jgi:hypothetical protein
VTFHELELTLNTPLGGFNNIKFGEMIPVSTPVKTKAWAYEGDDHSSIFDGDSTWDNSLQYFTTADATAAGNILFYFDMGVGNYADVSDGGYWTYYNADYAIGSGKLYGTNTDPATLSDADRINPNKYTEICDLTKYTST